MAKKGSKVSSHRSGNKGGFWGQPGCRLCRNIDGEGGVAQTLVQPVDETVRSRRVIMARHAEQGWCPVMAFILAYAPSRLTFAAARGVLRAVRA